MINVNVHSIGHRSLKYLQKPDTVPVNRYCPFATVFSVCELRVACCIAQPGNRD